MTDPDITALIQAAAAGQTGAEDRLLRLIYRDLVRLARSRLARNQAVTDLNAHALVHEAWLRFSGRLPADIASRRVFFAYAARAMESVVVDHVRRRQAGKRGDGQAAITLVTGEEGATQQHDEQQLLQLHAALQRLQRIDADLHQVVQLRYFAGLTVEQVAELMELSVSTVKRRWQQAVTILRQTLDEG